MNALTAIRLLIALARALNVPASVIADYWKDVDGAQAYFDEILAIINSDQDDTPKM
jgi:hypothetical protein